MIKVILFFVSFGLKRGVLRLKRGEKVIFGVCCWVVLGIFFVKKMGEWWDWEGNTLLLIGVGGN